MKRATRKCSFWEGSKLIKILKHRFRISCIFPNHAILTRFNSMFQKWGIIDLLLRGYNDYKMEGALGFDQIIIPPITSGDNK